MYEELAHAEERDGFELRLYLCEEDMAIADSFDSGADDIAELEDKVERGVYLWFCAKVTASKAGVELGVDYLGGCLYESADAFREEGGYYDDMCAAAINAARAKLAELQA